MLTRWRVWSRRRWYAAEARLDIVRTIGLRRTLRRRRAGKRHFEALGGKTRLAVEQMWREAADELGAELRALSPTLTEFRLGSATARVSHQRTPFADPVSTELADDKPLAYRLLADAGLPVPARVVIDARDRASAAAFAAQVDPPLLVKPVRGLGGQGVVGEIHTIAQLERALVHAGRIYPDVLIERQAHGDSYRILVLDGVVLDVLRRPRPTVTGDGTSTIEELLFSEYGRRIAAAGPAGLKPFSIDLDCLFTLEQQGLALDSIVPAGEPVVIKTATNYNGPDQSETVIGTAPESLLQPARQAAAILGVRLGGVDIVTADPTQPLEETGGVVLEVNAVPGLLHHYNVAGGDRATRIAIPILQTLLGVPHDARQGGTDHASVPAS